MPVFQTVLSELLNTTCDTKMIGSGHHLTEFGQSIYIPPRSQGNSTGIAQQAIDKSRPVQEVKVWPFGQPSDDCSRTTRAGLGKWLSEPAPPGRRPR